MPRNKSMNYSLYQTFIPGKESEKSLSSSKIRLLTKIFENLEHDKAEAVLMLICEHARRAEDFIYDPENIILPYSMKMKRGNVIFDIKNLPQDLQWVLWKFSNVINENSNTK